MQRERFALQMHKLKTMSVHYDKFWRNLNQVAVCLAKIIAFQIHKIVMFVGGEDFLLHNEIVGFKKAQINHKLE